MVIAALPDEDDGTRTARAEPAGDAQQATWDSLLVPILRLLEDGRAQQLRILQRILAGEDEESASLQGSLPLPGQRRPSDSRVALAMSHLVRAGAVERPSRGQYHITDTGRQVLAEFPKGLSQAEVEELADYAARRRSAPGRHERERPAPSTGLAGTPDGPVTTVSAAHQVSDGLERFREAVTASLLQRIHAQDLDAFGRTVVTLLEAMGYGTSGSPLTLARTADGGVEAVIDDDPLGLSRIYLQAKRLAPTGMPTGRSVIQAFIRETQERGLVQGMFITTGRLTADAWSHAQRASSRVVLVDGEGLASLMMRYGVGVRSRETVRLLDVDEEFFS